MNSKNSKHIVFLGLSGFPIGMAAIQRQILLGRALISEGWTVTVICTRSTHGNNVKIRKVGNYQGIRYVYLFDPIRKQNFFHRNFQKLSAPLIELFLLRKLNSKQDIYCAIVSNSNSFLNSIKSFLHSRIIGFKVIINLVEVYKERDRVTLFKKINDYFFNKFGLYFYDAFLPISDYIIDYFKSFHRRFHKIPVIVDVNTISNLNCQKSEQPFFLFCGAAAYYKSFDFIIESFGLVKRADCKLFLVTNGTKLQLDSIKNKAKTHGIEDRVVILKNLSDFELHTLYKRANGLLLPLFNTIQDKARFPHKLGEYLASSTVVLSNPVGEINNYLQNEINVMFSPSSDCRSYADNMEWVLENSQEALKIGERGLQVSSLNFDYTILAPGINDFLTSLK
ncbi:MAG: glycosyltransferase [Bacteroidia bacterium]|nr:glycosyltransferase [Bacteroidia bacterium]